MTPKNHTVNATKICERVNVDKCQHTANRESKNLVQKIAFHRNGIHFQDLSRQDQVFLLA